MKSIRAIYRAIAFSGLTLGCYLLWLMGQPVRPTWAWRDRIFTLWVKAITHLIPLRLHVQGCPPTPPYLLVTNHLSYLDLVILAHQLKGGVFIAKSEVAQWPVIGYMARQSQMIFIDRTRLRDIPRAIDDMQTHLSQHHGLILFPESTTSPGATVLPFYSSLLQPAITLGLPIHYASLSYRTHPPDPAATMAVCWWGEMTFLDHLFGLFQLNALEATLIFGPSPLTDTNRKQLARQLHQAVYQHFIPTAQEPTESQVSVRS